MNVRDLKLAIACGVETEEIKSLNEFFADLFSGLTIYTMDDKPDLIFMKNGNFVMQQDLKNSYLWCRYYYFWEVLQTIYHCTYTEIQEIIQYKVEDAFKMVSITPIASAARAGELVEDAFKMGSITPFYQQYHLIDLVEDAFKMGSLTPVMTITVYLRWVEDAFKMGSLTPKVNHNGQAQRVEDAFKMGSLTPLK